MADNDMDPRRDLIKPRGVVCNAQDSRANFHQTGRSPKGGGGAPARGIGDLQLQCGAPLPAHQFVYR